MSSPTFIRDVRRWNNTGIKLRKEDFPDYKSYKKEYDRQYSLKKRERRKELYQLNKEYWQTYQREHRKNNPEMYKKMSNTIMSKYYTDSRKRKTALERGWLRANIRINEDTFEWFDSTTNCEACNCELLCGKGDGKNKKNLDHDHHSGYPRNVVCKSCNI